MSEEFLYEKRVQYLRKKKWRKCQLQIEIIRRCQDKLVAIINDLSEKSCCLKFEIYGFECSNCLVALIGNNEIHHVKFESLELVSKMTELLIKYTKEVSYKMQLKYCSSPQSLLLNDHWYSLHVQTNRICFTTESSSRLVTKWSRSDIGHCCIKDGSLNIEIISKKDKILYLFYREEKFVLDHLFEAIKTLKFELPLRKLDTFISTPRRSVSVDLRKLTSWGNSKDRIARDRTYSSRTDDSSYNYDFSPSSTPCTPSFAFVGNEYFSSNRHSNIDEKDEELIFRLDSSNSDQLTDSKVNEYSNPNGDTDRPLTESNEKRLVPLERFPFESDFKSRGKLSPGLNFESPARRDSDFIRNLNMYEMSGNRSCYGTIASVKYNRKTCSEADFAQCKMQPTGDLSRSVDCKHLAAPLADTPSSHCPLSSSIVSSDTLPSSRSSDHDYYNMKGSAASPQGLLYRRTTISNNDDSLYYNLSHPLPSPPDCEPPGGLFCQRYLKHDLVERDRNDTVQYADLDFRDTPHSTVSRKVAPLRNYAEINILHTQALREIQPQRHWAYKKKRPSFFKAFCSK